MGGARRMPRPKGYHWDAVEPEIHPANGRPSCRWCRGRVDPPRRTFCGDPVCVAEWRRRMSWGLTRRGVYERARGVCALCGLDLTTVTPGHATTQAYLAACYERDRPARPLAGMVLDAHGAPYPPATWHERHRAAVAWYAAHRIPLSRDPWDADHILPVSQGGDWFAWDNLRCLCVPCHRVKTRADAASRAQARRAAQHAAGHDRRHGRRRPRRRAG